MENSFLSKTSGLIEKDRECLWHPYTQMKTARNFLPIVRGKGIYLYDENGKSFVDGTSSWCVNLHGHAHPYIVSKLQEQLEVLEHVTFADFTHPWAIELASRLLSILPGSLSKIYYSDNGSTSVEIALKMALQYWSNQNPRTEKSKVICIKGSYHGDTFGAMAVAGQNVFNQPFWKYLFHVETIDFPKKGREEESIMQLKQILHQGEAACFIYEPLILGVGGMHVYSANVLETFLRLCKAYEVITIADEVMTGFGRTTSLFASEYLTETPDIICLSKGLTGGFLPLGATACTQKIYDAFLSDDKHHALLHGHSYTGNTLACCSALASLDLLLEKSSEDQRQMIARQHEIFCQKWQSHPKLNRCVSLGTILILEYKGDLKTASYFQSIRDRLYYFFLDRGILLRPLGNVIYLMPPYCILEDELQWIYSVIIQTLEEAV